MEVESGANDTLVEEQLLHGLMIFKYRLKSKTEVSPWYMIFS